jgi:hypothetical protein
MHLLGLNAFITADPPMAMLSFCLYKMEHDDLTWWALYSQGIAFKTSDNGIVRYLIRYGIKQDSVVQCN